MTSIVHILSCMGAKDFKTLEKEARVSRLLQVYEQSIEKKYHPYWKQNWERALPFVEKLVMTEYKKTEFLVTSTTWGQPNYNVQILNLEPIHHNEEFVVLMMSAQSIWDSRDHLKYSYVGPSDNNAIQNSLQAWSTKYNESVNFDIVECGSIRYFTISAGYQELKGDGGDNMHTDTYKMEALVF